MLFEPMWQNILGIAAAVTLAYLLIRQYQSVKARSMRFPEELFGETKTVLDDARIETLPTAGSYRLSGKYAGLPVQVQTVTDTLNMRKLPSLWLLVTIPGELPLKAAFDMMMRPSGPSTFSNFDLLPTTIERPPDFPEHAVIRTDDEAHVLPAHVVAPYLAPFFRPGAKELLISPKGVRMVLQLAEADRLRYGVFRQAEFGAASVDPELLRGTLDRLIDLRHAILVWHGTVQ
jgi:hypothetical protein